MAYNNLKNKLQKLLAGTLVVIMTLTVTGGSGIKLQAGTRCQSGIKVAGKLYNYKYCDSGKTINLTMCKGTSSKTDAEHETAKFKKDEEPFYVEINDGIRIKNVNGEFRVVCSPEKHKTSWSSSRPSVASVSSKGVIKALKKGTAVITAKTTCGNRYKIKVTVVDHKYKKGTEYESYLKYCTICGDIPVGGFDVTEEEIHQRIIDAVGEDRAVYTNQSDDEDGDEIPGSSKWVCQDWQNWISKKVWGFGYRSSADIYNRRELKRSEYKDVRSGDLVEMYMYGEPHVCMVVENLHDGTCTVTGYTADGFYLGMTEEEAMEKNGCWSSYQILELDDYKAIIHIYTYYKN